MGNVLKDFENNLPTFSQMDKVRLFQSCGLQIRKSRDGVYIEYIKKNKNKYCAKVFNPNQYEKELKKAKYELEDNILLMSAK